MAVEMRSSWFSTAARRVTLLVCLSAVLLGGLGTQVYRVDMKMQAFRAGALGKSEVFYLPPREVLKVASLGRETFLASMLFVRFYAYFVDHFFSDRIFAWFDTYVDRILYLDPNNPRVYGWASERAKYGQLISNEAVDRSNYYAKLGIKQFPNDWRFYFQVGFNLYFEYKYKDEAEKKQKRDEALEYFTMAATLPNSQVDPNFITELYVRKNETEMALFQAYLAYYAASPRERRYLRRNIARLEFERMKERTEALKSGVKSRITELREEEERWKELFPFMPFGEFQVMVSEGDLTLPRTWRRTSAAAVRESYRAQEEETP